MTEEEFGLLTHGVYLVHWQPLTAGGGCSDVAVGRTLEGDIWFAPSNWVSPIVIPTQPHDPTKPAIPPGVTPIWEVILRMDRVYTQH